ncbi:LLM class flavin-dependent oxidoreductase [Pseudonocardia cypriaca]|uniref:Alkanesulfonate monooxygenase SsuD/methylene tetrahydromethanopterin reductase-like flavin-dependent oxidoreductase (Luciferase family) n=1 Tax=Pseudonocardia cypriaca TaxID=882449 RepID=A0A543FQ64_9PSEU|nr:LLM class flavin-dependent oxidoreductase [Pseudonocardia cypriaca]TQM35936.1 alkanesulfonate monooxygenase SsuD/methylene tetrahydromethanopterin reductase-like flavin-dependent oxidoreductase (luciferase family) [Pseudonocardia cypriaca]
MRLPSPCLVVLAGPVASGKSTWAAQNFPPDAVVSSDRLRALVGAGEDDIAASADALALLDEIVARRVARRLTTVVDTTGLDAGRRASWLRLAREHDLACVAVAFDTPAGVCRARNRARDRPVPAAVLTAQLKAWPGVHEALAGEGFDEVLAPEPVRVVPRTFVGSAAAADRQREVPVGLRFALHVGEFRGGAAGMRHRLREIAVAAEAAGFDAIYVMDHFRQIPQLGRAWEDFPESFTTLAWLAACTERVRLGTLVTAVTHRNVGHLAKIVATLDVLTGGRAICGIGLGWFEAEHRAYGFGFPPLAQRYALLEDALAALPVLWGPGGKPFRGQVLDLPDTSGYPRPLQEHVPIVLGGGGERRTLPLAARYADVANVLGELPAVARKAEVLREHCARTGRAVELSHLTTALVGGDPAEVDRLVEAHRPRTVDAGRYAEQVHAGTVTDQVGRFRELAEIGVAEVAVRLPDLRDAAPVARMAEVIAAFRG